MAGPPKWSTRVYLNPGLTLHIIFRSNPPRFIGRPQNKTPALFRMLLNQSRTKFCIFNPTGRSLQCAKAIQGLRVCVCMHVWADLYWHLVSSSLTQNGITIKRTCPIFPNHDFRQTRLYTFVFTETQARAVVSETAFKLFPLSGKLIQKCTYSILKSSRICIKSENYGTHF